MDDMAHPRYEKPPTDPTDPGLDLPWWAGWWQRRCLARTVEGPYRGRCELRRGHDGDHALERGFDIPRWSTRWTS